MNLLAHLLLADQSHTSFAGQILGDEIKGRLDGRFSAPIRQGIQLHRAIDSCTDAHAGHRRLRQSFEPPLRRYAGILVDIGLDRALTRQWPAFHNVSLAAFAAHAQRQTIAQWPHAAPFEAERLQRLACVLAGYAQPSGIQRALDSVSLRLRRDNPVASAWPALAARTDAFDAGIEPIMLSLQAMVEARAERV